jgi:cytochrome c peroxidase
MKNIKIAIAFSLLIFVLFAFQKDDLTEAQLGEKLFFDPILSADNSISCATCHKPEFAFADSATFSLGFHGELSERNTPSVMNMLARPYFFYDGRVTTLEEQVFHPIRNPKEMNLDISKAVKRLNNNDLYKKYFKKIYRHKPDSLHLGKAIAAYIRTLESDGSAPIDLYLNTKNRKAMSDAQIRGHGIFINKGKCFDCHFSPDFTGDEFRSIGTYDGKKYTDTGRFAITKDSADLGKFKTPSLRNIALTAPYMHNGMFRTLEEVIDYYDNPSKFVANPINLDTLMQKPLNLSQDEKSDLLAFLKALTDGNLKK